ncbi:MAG: aminopeptidase N [Candidatus Omnitrophota bacterium]|jgi:aminopeptidase N
MKRHKRTYLKDYRPPDYRIRETVLHVDLYEDRAVVKGALRIEAGRVGTMAAGELPPLVLDGEGLKLLEVKLGGRLLAPDEYEVTKTQLVLSGALVQKTRADGQGLPASFVVETSVEIEPQKNTALEGLYKSGPIFCTQNEPEGFRKITYYVDRPDVMSKFTTTITADKKKYPVLLSNGNLIASADLDDGRHFVTWQDPFPKPSYLFAMVAGDLGRVEDYFVTKSGCRVTLRIYVDKGNEPKCRYAMESLKKAMKWDEDTFGFEYDLKIYMIVAVDAFNMGAMENKGLNIFNSQYVLADPKTATDADFEHVLGVIAHEYFHNWTGNRITCRDWFQLTLKEGLTVFRDQEFSSDMTSRPVKRIQDARDMRDRQFVEDAGPNRHPIRPASYLEINNFYTATVYDKGAEVIRMIMTLIGRENFLKGMTKYVELYDGQAVTTENFVHAMELASGMDLTQFKLWYARAGTPVCKARSRYDKKRKRCLLTVEQKSREGKPLHFPLAVGLLLRKGAGKASILQIRKNRETFVFAGVPSRPVPSLLRDFSAPVRLDYPYTGEELAFLLSHDTDPFARYDAGFRLATACLQKLMGKRTGGPLACAPYVRAFGDLLADKKLDPAFKAEGMQLPSVTSLTETMKICDFESAFEAREFLLRSLAVAHEKTLAGIYRMLCDEGHHRMDSVSIGRRALKNSALAYLTALGKPAYAALAYRQFQNASNMTDEISALAMLCHTEAPERELALARFLEKWRGEFLVMLKWLAVQASSKRRDVLSQVKALETGGVYEPKNPNMIRALVSAFGGNLVRFHDASGAGYEYLASKVIEIDAFNPHVAANLASAFKKFSKLDVRHKRLMKQQLKRILAVKALSRNTFEIISKTLSA